MFFLKLLKYPAKLWQNSCNTLIENIEKIDRIASGKVGIFSMKNYIFYKNPKMKNWIYFHIKFLLSISEPFYKEPGWSLGLKNSYVVLSGVWS